MTDPLYRWPQVTKDADDTYPAQLGLWALCAQFWSPNEAYDIGDFAWPRIQVLNGQIIKGAIGFVMECTSAGRSATREPRWSLTADVAMDTLDGSVQWTPRVGDLQGVIPVTSPTVRSIIASDGVAQDLTTSSVIVNESTKLLVDYLGGTSGLSYDVEFSFTIGGRLRIGRQLVNVQ